jgi:hypothetical protein
MINVQQLVMQLTSQMQVLARCAAGIAEVRDSTTNKLGAIIIATREATDVIAGTLEGMHDGGMRGDVLSSLQATQEEGKKLLAFLNECGSMIESYETSRIALERYIARVM